MRGKSCQVKYLMLVPYKLPTGALSIRLSKSLKDTNLYDKRSSGPHRATRPARHASRTSPARSSPNGLLTVCPWERSGQGDESSCDKQYVRVASADSIG